MFHLDFKLKKKKCDLPNAHPYLQCSAGLLRRFLSYSRCKNCGDKFDINVHDAEECPKKGFQPFSISMRKNWRLFEKSKIESMFVTELKDNFNKEFTGILGILY